MVRVARHNYLSLHFITFLTFLLHSTFCTRMHKGLAAHRFNKIIMRRRIEAACIFHNLICHNVVRQCAHSHTVYMHTRLMCMHLLTRALQRVCKMQNKAGGEIGGGRERERQRPPERRIGRNWNWLSPAHSLARVQWPATHRSLRQSASSRKGSSAHLSRRLSVAIFA